MIQGVVPPYMLERLAQSENRRVRQVAIANLVTGERIRTERRLSSEVAGLLSAARGREGVMRKSRAVYVASADGHLPGQLVRREGQAKVSDTAANEAYAASGATLDFYARVFKRNSLDGQGMAVVSTVHVTEPGGAPLNNAFWNGAQMAYGDGDGVVFNRFTRCLEVVGHELTHGVQAYASNLAYQGESGALNEHFSDVFGILVRQWKKRETADQAHWLIGAELLMRARQGSRRAIRDMLNPGTAYRDDPDLGNDPQPDHYRRRYTGRQDNGGVHINSGIANRAFALAAVRLGGYAWETVGPVWYALMLQLSRTSSFADCARLARQIARDQPTEVFKAVDAGWKAVGL